jgi:DHA1 family tetracycline resistance protein-like MFS transporter
VTARSVVDAAETSRTGKPAIGFVLSFVMLNAFGNGVVIPVLPRLIQSFDGDMAKASQHYGVLVSIAAILQLVFWPLCLRLSDRFGRRPVMLLSMLGRAIDFSILAVAPSLAWVFVARIVSAATSSTVPAANAYVADTTPPEKRAQNFGLVNAAFALGLVLGPALGGFLGGIHLRAPLFISALLNAGNFVVGVYALPESLSPELRRPFSWKSAIPLGSLLLLARTSAFVAFAGSIACTYLTQHMLRSTWALYTQARYGWGSADVGLSFTCAGAVGALVNVFLARIAVARFGERSAVLAGMLCTLLALIGFGLAPRGWMIYAFLVPFGLGALASTALQSVMSQMVDAAEQGALQGALVTLSGIMAVAGPLLGTSLLTRFTMTMERSWTAGAPFLAGACLNVLGLVLVLRAFRRAAGQARGDRDRTAEGT